MNPALHAREQSSQCCSLCTVPSGAVHASIAPSPGVQCSSLCPNAPSPEVQCSSMHPVQGRHAPSVAQWIEPRPPTVQARVYYAVRLINSFSLVIKTFFQYFNIKDTNFMNESFIKISRTFVESQADPGLEL